MRADQPYQPTSQTNETSDVRSFQTTVGQKRREEEENTDEKQERGCLSDRKKSVCRGTVRFGSSPRFSSSDPDDEREFDSVGNFTTVEVVFFGSCHVTEFDRGGEERCKTQEWVGLILFPLRG